MSQAFTEWQKAYKELEEARKGALDLANRIESELMAGTLPPGPVRQRAEFVIGHLKEAAAIPAMGQRTVMPYRPSAPWPQNLPKPDEIYAVQTRLRDALMQERARFDALLPAEQSKAAKIRR